MKHFFRIKTTPISPQLLSIHFKGDIYRPVFWHASIDQDRPVGSQATFREHIHNFYHIVLYTKGEGAYSREGHFYTAQPGVCVLVHPNQRHDFVSKLRTAVYSELTFSYVNPQNEPLSCSFEQLLSLYSGLTVTLPDGLRVSSESRRILQALLIQMIDYLNSGRDLSMYHAHRTLSHIFNFLVEHRTNTIESEIIEDRFVRARMWIEEHYLESFSMDELAKSAGVSKGYFFRAFKKAFGVPPVVYQQQLRIEAAKTLLKATSLKCNEISFRVGFSDVYYFYRVFKKHTGITPKNYRKEVFSQLPQNHFK